MQTVSFIASSAEEAVTQIRGKLGPEAVVLNVRPLPQPGLSRLWQKPMIEVLACVPQAPVPPAEPLTEVLAEFRKQLEDIRGQVEGRGSSNENRASFPAPGVAGLPSFLETVNLNQEKWQVGALLQKSGLMPVFAQKILDDLTVAHGENPPESLVDQLALAHAELSKYWRRPASLAPNSVHVLIGPAGSGKTTCLCKWLTQATLMEGKLSRIWRLDGATANMAESLSVYCEILDMPCERTWQRPAGNAELPEDIGFIDLPGVDWRQPLAIKELAGQLKQLGSPRIHLVLNGAYDASLLLAQARAFEALPVEDVILTHLDEESRWGKVWNLVMGTNFSLRYFSTGQNIPGDFCPASPDLILERQMPCK
jgi:flagellar biosynthesis protein FlhF